MRDWAQSRAVEARRVSGGLAGSGVESWQRRLPRSKVGGMGFVTVTELEEGVVSEVRVRWEVEDGIHGFSGWEVLGAELRVPEESTCDVSIVDVSGTMVMVRLLNV